VSGHPEIKAVRSHCAASLASETGSFEFATFQVATPQPAVSIKRKLICSPKNFCEFYIIGQIQASTIMSASKQNCGCVVDYLVTYAPISPVDREPLLLSRRQRQTFDLVVAGRSNKEIARTLGVSESTVKIHITNLFEKLGVRHRSAFALAGAKFGLSLCSAYTAGRIDRLSD
jgi:DNA-binding CsgD family transcriptional regulator